MKLNHSHVQNFLVDLWKVPSSVVRLRVWAGSIIIEISLAGAGINTVGLANNLVELFMSGEMQLIQGWKILRMTSLDPLAPTWLFEPGAPTATPSATPTRAAQSLATASPTVLVTAASASVRQGLINADFKTGDSSGLLGWVAFDDARLVKDNSLRQLTIVNTRDQGGFVQQQVPVTPRSIYRWAMTGYSDSLTEIKMYVGTRAYSGAQLEMFVWDEAPQLDKHLSTKELIFSVLNLGSDIGTA